MRASLAVCVALLSPFAAAAQDTRPAAGVDLFVSDDADDTEVQKLGATLDWRFTDSRHYRGVEFERARLAPLGRPGATFDRAYLRFADTSGAWEWSGRVGSDGDRLIGNAALVRTGRYRGEAFIERDLLETRGGIARGQTVTFAGASIDLPLGRDDRRQLTLLGGVQDFDDGNLRTHLRANLVQTLSERAGLSAQLRVRAFQNSEPFAGDYFSPRRFIEAIPVLQLRRRFAGGWRATLAAGSGRQRQTGSDWRQARLLQASVSSPDRPSTGFLRAGFTYTDTPGVGGTGYGYRQLTLQWVRPL